MKSPYPLAHKIKIDVPYRSGSDVRATVAAARKRKPLCGPVRTVFVGTLDLMHPDHPRFIAGQVQAELM